uniref:HutD/Ves family protein n=1 Tax=uncultured Sphingomonas sp. TaxID=158754 RepID=UPI0035CC8643
MLIRAADCPQVAWKNGGGTTREIATFPVGAGMDGFLWRLSAARVDAPGPFSHFAGVDRTIAILSGRLLLHVAGRDPVRLAPGSAAYDFPGDLPAYGTPEDGPVADLNLMVRREAGAGAIRTIGAGAITAVAAGTILVATQDMVLCIGADSVAMRAHDAFRFDAPSSDPVTVDAPVQMVSVTIRDGIAGGRDTALRA